MLQRWRRRILGVRGDETAQVTLLAGIMAFLLTILAISTMDMGNALYRRIVVQNAADAAADASALWQARGINTLQFINNWHRDTLDDLYDIAITACTIKCVYDICDMCDEVFEACLACKYAMLGIMMAALPQCCDNGDKIERSAKMLTQMVLKVQEAIAATFPFYALSRASAVAKGSGADPIVPGPALRFYKEDLGPQVGAFLFEALGIPSTSVTSTEVGAATARKIAQQLQNQKAAGAAKLAPKVLYALPLDPGALSLGVRKNPNPGNSPWRVDEDWPVCDPEFKWQAAYYYGNPGYTTWMTTKMRAKELLELGDLAWFNGSGNKLDPHALYVGEARRSVGERMRMRVPQLAGLASSQTQGKLVEYKKPLDAKGHLIPVFLPNQGNKSGTLIGVFH